jgi:prefoldin alpha subunit
VHQLTESLANLQKAVGRYHTSGRALEQMVDEVEGKEMLVPLTSSLYVPGRLGDTAKVLLDVGTGYFVEKSPADGVDYCKRKVGLVRENMEKLIEVIAAKRKQATQVQQVFGMKMQAMEAARMKNEEIGT